MNSEFFTLDIQNQEVSDLDFTTKSASSPSIEVPDELVGSEIGVLGTNLESVRTKSKYPERLRSPANARMDAPDLQNFRPPNSKMTYRNQDAPKHGSFPPNSSVLRSQIPEMHSERRGKIQMTLNHSGEFKSAQFSSETGSIAVQEILDSVGVDVDELVAQNSGQFYFAGDVAHSAAIKIPGQQILQQNLPTQVLSTAQPITASSQKITASMIPSKNTTLENLDNVGVAVDVPDNQNYSQSDFAGVVAHSDAHKFSGQQILQQNLPVHVLSNEQPSTDVSQKILASTTPSKNTGYLFYRSSRIDASCISFVNIIWQGTQS